jgi:hypothetical protein
VPTARPSFFRTARASFFRNAVTGRSTLTLTCAGCGCVYRTAVDPPPVKVLAAETNGKDTAAAPPPVDPPDLRPCPFCGLVSQPAFARSTQSRHLWVWFATGSTAAALGGFAAAGVLPFVAAAVLVPAWGVVGLVLHLRIAAGNPNRKPRADNLARGKDHVAATRTEVLLPGRPEVERDPPAWTRRHTAGILLAALAPLALLSPAWLRTILDRSANPTFDPTVVTPGMTFTAPLPSPTFRSYNGWWRAVAKVEVLNAEGGHTPGTFAATTHPDWDGRPPAATAPRSTPELHAVVTLPDDPALDGRRLDLRATLNVTYPAFVTVKGIDNQTMTITHEFPVVVAKRADRWAYAIAAWGGTAACLVGWGLGGRLLASGIGAVKGQITNPELVRLGGERARA